MFGEKYASVPVRDTESSAVYDFERKYFKYDIVTPRASFDYTPDDGLFLGAGLYIERQQYKEDPKATHLIKANWATRTNGFNAAYNGRYNSFIAKHWDVEIDTWGHNSDDVGSSEAPVLTCVVRSHASMHAISFATNF